MERKMSSFLGPSQILELNVISAQDLAPVAKCMKTYAVAWLHPDRKLTTRVDNTGGTSPTWNDKFVFRLDEESLYDDTSLVVIEIYALHWFKDIHVGTVQALISDLVRPSSGMRFVMLEVLRASGRPRGLLNIAVGLIDSSMRSMPLYNKPSAFEEDLTLQHKNIPSSMPKIQRSKSDSSSMVESELSGLMEANSKKFGVNGEIDHNNVQTPKDSKFVITDESSRTTSGSDKNEFSSDSQMVAYAFPPPPPPHKTPNVTKPQMPHGRSFPKDYEWLKTSPQKVPKHLVYGTPMRTKHVEPNPTKNRVEYGTPMRSRPALITDSELGPSASVVAAQIAKERVLAGKDGESTVISNDELSVEGLQSKLERWQADLPPVVDVNSNYEPNSTHNKPPNANYKPISMYKPNEANHVKHLQMSGALVKKHSRRHTDGGSGGLFSCFSNICGIECSIVCGSSAPKGSKKKKRK